MIVEGCERCGKPLTDGRWDPICTPCALAEAWPWLYLRWVVVVIVVAALVVVGGRLLRIG
jgi:hypothetical protein